eukprot:TRINITY_DN123523_c0_g1_i1.p1 TRINITY_DN123523_c0_g1~~TRINITY_DN123523_c0_g1_i1.p1  ORF type:complete len:277 (-),score=34.51 TRINITY_DN123523_c0_g1_i1:220-1002(-)
MAVAGQVRLSTLHVTIFKAGGLPAADTAGEAYCTCGIAGQKSKEFQTSVAKSSTSPVWNHTGEIAGYADGDSLEFRVWQKLGSGHEQVLAQGAVSGKLKFPIEGELPLDGQGGTGQSRLHVYIEAVQGGLLAAGSQGAAASLTFGQRPVLLSNPQGWSNLTRFTTLTLAKLSAMERRVERSGALGLARALEKVQRRRTREAFASLHRHSSVDTFIHARANAEEMLRRLQSMVENFDMESDHFVEDIVQSMMEEEKAIRAH